MMLSHILGLCHNNYSSLKKKSHQNKNGPMRHLLIIFIPREITPQDQHVLPYKMLSLGSYSKY